MIARLTMLAVMTAVGAEQAWAQACHDPQEVAVAPIGARATVDADLGAPTTADGPTFAGVGLRLDGRYRDFAAFTALRGYQVVRPEARASGLGDLLIGLRHRTLTRGDHAGTGPSIAATLPTGSREDGLGMGHAMMMAGLWGWWSWSGVSVVAEAGYGRALGGDGHAAHGPGVQLVDPMNRSELGGAAAVTIPVAASWRLRSSATAAVPIGDHAGESRARASVGGSWEGARTSLGAQVELPIAGFDYAVRLRVSLGVRWGGPNQRPATAYATQ